MTLSVRFHATGGPDVLTVEDLPLADPGPGEVRVRHTAIGVNYIDTYHRSGLYPVPLPGCPGMEAAGVVEAVGPDVTRVAVGQRVAYGTGPTGAYAAARIVPEAILLPLPEGIADEQAAAMMLRGMTVQYLIRRTFPVAPGMTVLLHAAAGGLGLIACQWLRHLGVTIIGTVGSEKKREIALAHGCTHVVIPSQEDLVARVRDLTDGKGVPVVYDGVGAALFEASLDCLRPRGMMVTFGNASGPVPPFPPTLLTQKGSLFLTRPSLNHYTAERDELEATAADLFEVVQKGVVSITIGQRFPLAEAAAAHRALESRATVGSTILLP
ncbi:quinone oxidoreductase family protein [Pararhodospirillum oryzae]|uniref:Quinone oxidoreductase n=1 Tax=Pararhodospirillum oryzae TaxID=478448 RepID=A0A512H3K8_9PROT|nr:quinone oxidoreductase [Pararhodospirillum oryzae]GEO80045.1 quinone oxidoreductase [Pararhodospirillum oryzae]